MTHTLTAQERTILHALRRLEYDGLPAATLDGSPTDCMVRLRHYTIPDLVAAVAGMSGSDCDRVIRQLEARGMVRVTRRTDGAWGWGEIRLRLDDGRVIVIVPGNVGPLAVVHVHVGTPRSDGGLLNVVSSMQSLNLPGGFKVLALDAAGIEAIRQEPATKEPAGDEPPANESPTTKPPKKPSENDFKIYRTCFLYGRKFRGTLSQSEIAELVSKEGIPCKQTKVSRAVDRVEAWMKAGNVLPDIESAKVKSSKVQVSPDILDMGERSDGRALRQRQKHNSTHE